MAKGVFVSSTGDVSQKGVILPSVLDRPLSSPTSQTGSLASPDSPPPRPPPSPVPDVRSWTGRAPRCHRASPLFSARARRPQRAGRPRLGASAASGDGLALYGHALTRPQISRRPDFYAFAQSSSPDAPPHMRKRQRTMDATSVDAHPAMAQRGPPPPPMSVNEDAFITDEHAADDGDDDDANSTR